MKHWQNVTLPTQLAWQIRLLSAQFLLGMAVNLIGLPSETRGFAHTSSTVLLAAHVVAAVALLANSLVMIKLARPYGAPALRLAWLGAGGIMAAMAGGLLTLTAPLTNWWSYLMAVAFLAIFAFYGRLHPIVSRPAPSPTLKERTKA